MNEPATVDILLSVLNGLPYLREQLESLQAQTHRDWRLWVRDDASTDGTVELLREFEARDPRIRLISQGPDRWDVSRSFGWLLEQRWREARYVMFCDADDVWLPDKIEATLAAMRAAEAEAGAETPVLVHTDLRVVDRQLAPVADSMWRLEAVRPERTSLRRLVVHNVATGPTIMMNRALCELASPIPEAAHAQDWWVALVAFRFGRIVPLWRPTVLYRQHGGNRSGAHGLELSGGQLLRKVAASLRNTPRLRQGIAETALQAEAFLARYHDRLEPAEQRMLARYAEIPRCGTLRRKLRVLQLRTLEEHGVLRNIGLVLRA